MSFQLPYTASEEIVNLVARISEAIGRVTALTETEAALRLRRINRVRTVHGSLAIAGNTLSEAQITAILDGRSTRYVTPSPPMNASRTGIGTASKTCWRRTVS